MDDLFPEVTRTSDGWLDLRARDLRGLNLSGRALTRVRFGDKDLLREPACLVGISFRGSSFDTVHFTQTTLERNDFRGSTLEGCDFRYVTFAQTTFANTLIVETDFYRAYFGSATVFAKATLRRISLDKAWLQGITGLERSTFEVRPEAPALVQEADDESYRVFLRRTEHQRLQEHASGTSSPDAIAAALASKRTVAAEVYRALSGLWTSLGQFDAATFAYVRSKNLERDQLKLELARRLPWKPSSRGETGQSANLDGQPRSSGAADLGAFLWLSLARWTCNFGSDLRRIVVAIIALVVIPGAIYALAGGVHDAKQHPVGSLSTCMIFSLEQITTLSSTRFLPANQLVELAGSLQAMLGIALLGLFGFVLGNKIRNA